MNPKQHKDKADSQRIHKPPRSPAEWVSFSVASLILAGIIGTVGYLWAEQEHQNPPDIVVLSSDNIRESNGQFYVSFVVRNVGGSTATAVQVVAELELNDGVEETGEQQIDFLSAGETETGAFVFSQNPRLGELTLRVASYKLP